MDAVGSVGPPALAQRQLPPLEVGQELLPFIDDGVALTSELSRWPGGRALYDPQPGEPRTSGPGVSCRFYYSGDTP
ncbi:hypothetical protein MHW47_22400 [Streptomyces sp. OfavH-34-F]|uniref:hypothetical protein n=1 Tax=Streptomyces sp. OfavH-34-F TaxID=2917760 RepID=UPI001EF201CE|nr:hypothetical protein [Streptomyces sp. OfavH-34-F]MCG7527185.1 hypothetical protein [Streptomyces sp. OfavH-34-F]